MANAFYTDFFDQLADALHDFGSHTFKVIGVDSADYTFSAAHTGLSDIAAGARIGTGTLASISITDGVIDAADTTMSAVTGDQFEYLVIYNDTHASDALVCKIDDYTGLPCTPNGEDITIVWPAGGIISLI